MTPEELLKDPEFHKLPDSDKLIIFGQADPEFAKLPGTDQSAIMLRFSPTPGAQALTGPPTPGATPAQAPPQPVPMDPTSASLGMFAPGEMQAPTGEQIAQGGQNLYDQMPTGREWAKMGLGIIPPALATLGGAVGAGSGLLTGGATSLPGAAIGATTMGAAGESLRQAIAQKTGLEPPGTVKENIGNQAQQGLMAGGSTLIPGGSWFRSIIGGGLTGGGAEAAKQGITGDYNLGKIGLSTGLGMGAGVVGEGFAKGMERMFFGKPINLAKTAEDTFKDFAAKNKLPYSVDALSSKPSLALTQAAGDYGPGSLITNWQRGKLIEKTTKLSKMVNDELGLMPPAEMQMAADKLVDATKLLIDTGKTHAGWNRALDSLPKDKLYDAQNLMATVEKLGGIDIVDDLFLRSGHVSRIGAAIKRIDERGGDYIKSDLEYIINNINPRIRELYKKKDWIAYNNAKEIKQSIMEDIGYIAIPELQTTLKAVRAANDLAYSQAKKVIDGYPVLSRLLQPTANTPAVTLSLFNDSNAPAAMALREKLIATDEGKMAWELLQSSYLKKIFDNTLVTRPDFPRKVFDPGKYIDWFEKYGLAASKIMPDIAPALHDWNQISQGLLKDYGRRTSTLSALKMAGASLGIGGGGGYAAGGPVLMTAIPGFSILAALGTMGPGNWGFIRNSLTKQASSPIGMNSRMLSVAPQMEIMEGNK